MIVVSAAAPGVAERAAAVLDAGGVVAFPTDTVYGIAAALDDGDAPHRVFVIKGRPDSKPLPVLIADRARLGRVALPLGAAVEALADRFWPGALTLVVPARDGLPAEVLGINQTVGVRVPAHDLTRAVLAAAGGALAVTSANRSGMPPAVTAAEVADQLEETIDLLVDGGRVGGGTPSTVVAVTAGGWTVLREGAIAAAEIDSVWRCIFGPDEKPD